MFIERDCEAPHHKVFLCVLPSSTPCILPEARRFTLFFTGRTSQRFRVPVCKERTSLTQPLGYLVRSYSKAWVRIPSTFPSLMSLTPRRALRVVQSRWPLGILCPQITGVGRALMSARQKGLRDVPPFISHQSCKVSVTSLKAEHPSFPHPIYECFARTSSV